MTTKIMIVDDSSLYQQLVKNVLRSLEDVEIVGQAKTGREALAKIPDLQPDLLTLDVQMPDMNGLELLKEIRRRRMPVKAIMLSSLTAQGTQVTTDALLAGAFDFIHKPNSSDATASRQELHNLLNEKIVAFQQSRKTSMPARRSNTPVATWDKAKASNVDVPQTLESLETNAGSGAITSSVEAAQQPNRIDAVVIGTSTGGPMALRELIPKLPSDLGVPVFVVQHMPPKYTQSLALRLSEASTLPVLEAVDGMRVEPNQVYIAPGGLHMGIETVMGKPVIRTSNEAHEHNCRPAVDYTLRSACNFYRGNLLGVILTGMGRDGTAGCRNVKESGGTVFAQHPEGCTVYGMPKVIVEEQLADRVIPLEKMASWIIRFVEKSRC
ncbi:Chemotaxis response regulator protein-glutamate methylesterase [Pirellula sp. SH-Sr6A]|uniref:protein-glutamate methylesterase/protein-glutamine glutaminase n=1 Tax=Pirellula sp. SH-Sr6A TaxID=1632865 RepID=UPI00078E6AC9|nr:chemotaxis response regulator protein-glutamate methylesterase [Pirellula sp. SH-Sr6A]AMV35409.1 Chemotaxis response regulator protein-glutamate methylesterase [Pirellula sp. SH-Sr6A]